MQGLKDATTNEVYVVLGTIKRIVNRENFWYTACICSKAVIPDSQMFYCEKCDRHVKKVFSRYCLRVRAIDHTDCATLVIFDKEATALFNKSCVDMLAEHGVAVSEGHLPPEIAGIIGKTFLFKVETKVDQNPRFEQSFRVRKICAMPDVINEFKKKWGEEEAAFFKNAMEASSLSVLLDKGKAPMIAGSSDVLNQDDFSLTEPVEKCKEMLLGEGSGIVTQDLLPKFAVADCEFDVVEISQKGSAASSKRGSPTTDDDEMNMSLKMLRKTIKIEKP
ncbi:putative nucleic acid-binding protein [Medicago truncatula]|nr:putative nucleic acid-binding protein [Medicago truncatula]